MDRTSLSNLASDADNRRTIVSASVIKPFISLAGSGSEMQKQWVANALGNLALDTYNRREIVSLGTIKTLTELLRNGTDG